jgi:putative ABC transport system permease protein
MVTTPIRGLAPLVRNNNNMKTVQNFIFVLKRFKTSSILNILGLSVAFAVFAITMMQAYYDFSFDRNFKNSKNIYQFSAFQNWQEKQISSISIPLAQLIADKSPEVQAYCVIRAGSEREFKLQGGKLSLFNLRTTVANEGFLDVFTPHILAGDAKQAFTERNKVMLTDDAAQLLFGKENPIGQAITSDTTVYTVVAVCERFPDNCSLKNGVYTTVIDAVDYNLISWYNYDGYFLGNSGDMRTLQEKLNHPEYLNLEDEPLEGVELTPLADSYFLQIKGKEETGSLATTLSLMAIGILILVIAFINFMNFSMAMIPSRVRGINIQKIVGANPQRLKYLVTSEAVGFALGSFVIALFLIVLFNKTDLHTFFVVDLSLEKNIPLLLLIALSGIGLAVLFGIYPAHRVTSYQPAMVLSGSFSQSKPSVLLRNLLITLQFFFAIVLIVVAIFIKIQHDYMRNYSWGFEQENVLYVPVKTGDIDVATFENELKQNSDILDCTISAALPGHIGMTLGMDVAGKNIASEAWVVRHDFLDFFGIKVIEGRDFIVSDDGKSRVICNQTFLKKYEFSKIVGTKVEDNGYEIVGVIDDIHFESLHSEIQPLFFLTQDMDYNAKYGNYFFIKIAGSHTLQTIESIEKIWKKLSDEPIDLNFLDASMDKLYEKESNLAKLISIFGVIAVIIAVMGVYGLIVFNAKYKRKEIAIRKVNGSTIKEIMLMLNRNVLMQLGIAFVIAVPVAYFIVQKWLESFAYKTPVYGWVFLLGGMIILLITVITVSAQSKQKQKKKKKRRKRRRRNKREKE